MVRVQFFFTIPSSHSSFPPKAKIRVIFAIFMLKFFAKKGGGGQIFVHFVPPYANVWLALFPTGSKF